MATLADVAVDVEEQESARVQQELKVLFHQLCMLFGFLIMLLLLTESTLYWLIVSRCPDHQTRELCSSATSINGRMKSMSMSMTAMVPLPTRSPPTL